ncbi:MAG: hypothetical protein IKK11_04165 [Oscillospiraceae bacterium]|nr:hypothetical protein [Oscillospiraceae bacterium]
MKKILLLLLCGILIFNAVSCSRNDDPEETDGTEGITASKYTFISNEEKSTWKSNLTAVLSKIEIHDEPGIPGSFAIGLMDINFDNSPEVFAAHAGGSMGNVFIEIYDLDSGEQLISYNAAHWESSENIYLCVADKNGEYVVLSEGALRNDIGWMKLIDLLPKNIDSQAVYLMTESLFAEALSNEAEHYEYKGNIVDKSQYDEYYRIFLDEYNKIESTQIQLIKWSSIESENRNELVEKMADALIHTSQDFIDNKK